MTLSAPVPLADHHELAGFNSGVAELDDWLLKRARSNQASGASRTFVLCEGNRVVGYYALASGAVTQAEAPGKIRRNMPDPIPFAVLGRLAIDTAHQGKGVGRAMVRDAGFRLMQAAEVLGIRGLLVHAISEEAKAFYLALGFTPSPLDPMMLMVTLRDLSAVASPR
ncbi:Acetyltransferase (GNAT) domain-containing protein [Bosea lupini]|uniref:Acetyltransferase (GNAT) domain-containing protein n=1 Tax=Bosea lupini TaxID=1036779 RepID=A0A1H7WEY4_9HYPH|nr:GNAT family N-acetyltransferase [Bosea lupini]SEM19904.1 Acetyltransferase (GNAT) domain-containing protein [Bosea lupini]